MKPQHERFIYSYTPDIDAVPTSHNSGEKKVISRGFGGPVRVKQIAVAVLQEGETVAPHVHPDMDECYYILEGNGVIYIDERPYKLGPDVFVNVPAGTSHSIECTGGRLRFVYSCLELTTDVI